MTQRKRAGKAWVQNVSTRGHWSTSKSEVRSYLWSRGHLFATTYSVVSYVNPLIPLCHMSTQPFQCSSWGHWWHGFIGSSYGCLENLCTQQTVRKKKPRWLKHNGLLWFDLAFSHVSKWLLIHVLSIDTNSHCKRKNAKPSKRTSKEPVLKWNSQESTLFSGESSWKRNIWQWLPKKKQKKKNTHTHTHKIKQKINAKGCLPSRIPDLCMWF